MIEPNFTIMIPTRKRQHMLKALLQSIYKTAGLKNQVEVLVTYDTDDQSTIDALPEIKAQVEGYPVQFFSRERHYSISVAYYNEMAKKANGKYLIAVNDDTVFLKSAWDIEALIKIENYLINRPDGIFYGITEDREVEHKRNEYNYFSCFPLISKKAVDALGFFFDPQFFKDGADWDIIETYRELGRVLDLRNEIIIEHISFRSGRRPHDLLDEDVMLIPPTENPVGPSAGINKGRNINQLREFMNKNVK